MSSTFVERLINRTTRNKVIQIKPALTPDVLPQIFQLQELPSEPYSEHPAPLPYSQEKISSPTAPSPKQDSPVQPHTQTLSTQSKQQDEQKRPQPTENLPHKLETSPTQTTTVNKQPIEAKQQLKREFTQSSFASYEPIASAEPNPQRRKADHANGSDVKEKDTVVLAEKTALETNVKVAPTAVEESEVQPTKGQPSLSLSANKERLAHADEIAKPVKAEPMRDLQFIQRKDEDSFTPKVNVKINQVLNRIEKQNSNSKVEVSSPSVMVTPRHNGAQEATTSGVASHKATEALTKEVSKLHNMSIRPAESTTKAKMSTQGLFQEFKPRLPKETETTVTIHIGRIEVHAAKEQEQPITLPRSPALSLSEYLKKRSEEN